MTVQQTGKKRSKSHFSNNDLTAHQMAAASIDYDEDALMLNYLALFAAPTANEQYVRLRRYSSLADDFQEGIVETCCQRECTVATMLEFCGN